MFSDSGPEGLNRLFPLSFEDNVHKTICTEYFLPAVKIKDLKTLKYPFKHNENMLIYIKVFLYTYFHYNSLNVLRRTFFSIYYLPFQILGKSGSKLGQTLTFFLLYEFLHQQNFVSLKCNELRR